MERHRIFLLACCLAAVMAVAGCRAFMPRSYGLPQQWEAQPGQLD